LVEPVEGASGGELAEVVRGFRSHPGLLGKARIAMVTDILGPTDWDRGPGDDAAVLPQHDGRQALVAGEAMWPPFVERDPFGAGIAAVLANVNDVAAMGGRPEALVDTIVADESSARSALEGLRFGSELYRVPVVGGHLTIRSGPPALSAFVFGTARRPLRALDAAPGQALLFCACLDGGMREDFPFFSSIRERGAALAAGRPRTSVWRESSGRWRCCWSRLAAAFWSTSTPCRDRRACRSPTGWAPSRRWASCFARFPRRYRPAAPPSVRGGWRASRSGCSTPPAPCAPGSAGRRNY
jgi:AIR synthase related protein, N-terminal domain